MPDNPNATAELTGFVLAGGRSSRMGTDKAALLLNGRTLLEHAIGMVGAVTGEPVFILGSRQLYASYGEVIEDHYPGCGPLAGIHAALSRSHTRFNLIIAVDTPFLSPEFLQHMTRRAIESEAVVTVPEIAGYTQPLCAVYSREFLPIAEKALKSGSFKIVPLFPKEKTCIVTEAELARFAFNAEMFENLNTPEDMKRARRRAIAPAEE
jgi:molybdopterin-guanine dinucleotide biosynthesis protein A